MGRSLSSAIQSYNALVAIHGEEGAYNIIQASLAAEPAARVDGGAMVDQVIEDLAASATAVRSARPAAQLATRGTTQAAQSIGLLKELLGI